MDMEKLTNKSREALLGAQGVAAEHGHQEMRPMHLLKALSAQEGGLVPSLLKRMGVNAESIGSKIDKIGRAHV